MLKRYRHAFDLEKQEKKNSSKKLLLIAQKQKERKQYFEIGDEIQKIIETIQKSKEELEIKMTKTEEDEKELELYGQFLEVYNADRKTKRAQVVKDTDRKNQSKEESDRSFNTETLPSVLDSSSLKLSQRAKSRGWKVMQEQTRIHMDAARIKRDERQKMRQKSQEDLEEVRQYMRVLLAELYKQPQNKRNIQLIRYVETI